MTENTDDLVRRARAGMEGQETPREREDRLAYEAALAGARQALEALRQLWPERLSGVSPTSKDRLATAERGAASLVAILLDLREEFMGSIVDAAEHGVDLTEQQDD